MDNHGFGPLLLPIAFVLMFAPAATAGDLGFISGSFAVAPDDCKKLGGGKPFSKEWVAALDSEVLTADGITSPRETHCRFKSADGGAGKWKVKSTCEEMGEASEVDVQIAAGEGGAFIVTQEDWFGQPLTFAPCGK